MVYFVLQPISWINTIVSLQYRIVQNCRVKSIVSHNDLNSTVGMILYYFNPQCWTWATATNVVLFRGLCVLSVGHKREPCKNG